MTLSNTIQFVTLSNTKQFATLSTTIQFVTLSNTIQFVTLCNTIQFVTLSSTIQFVTLSKIVVCDIAPNRKVSHRSPVQHQTASGQKKSSVMMTLIAQARDCVSDQQTDDWYHVLTLTCPNVILCG